MALTSRPAVHGGNVEAAARAWGCSSGDVLDLSTGVYPEPAPDALGALLAELAPVVMRYPDPDGEPARTELAGALGVPCEQLLISAGAQAVIEVLFAAVRWPAIRLAEPCYAEVRRCAERAGVRVLGPETPVRGEIGVAEGSEGEDVRPWIIAPDSLTGAWGWGPGSDGLDAGVDDPCGVGEGVLDESYASFDARRGRGVSGGWIRIGSLTKCFSMPGLRLGYVIAPEPRIAQLRAHLPPWPAPTLALHLLPHLLPSWRVRDARVERGRERLRELLERYGWRTRPSKASFVLGRPERGMPDFVRARILVRMFPEWPTLSGWIRLGIPATEAEWKRLETALCP